MKRIKWYHIIMYLCLLFSIILIGYSAFCYKNDSTKFRDDTKEYLTKGWKYINKDGIEENIKVPNKLNAEKGDTIVITRKIPNKNLNDAALLFGTYHTFVKVYADDELIYSYGKKEEIPRIMYGNRSDLLLYILKNSMPLMLFSIIPFAIGIIIMLFFFIWGMHLQ